jgi:hypothetical protein
MPHNLPANVTVLHRGVRPIAGLKLITNDTSAAERMDVSDQFTDPWQNEHSFEADPDEQMRDEALSMTGVMIIAFIAGMVTAWALQLLVVQLISAGAWAVSAAGF